VGRLEDGSLDPGAEFQQGDFTFRLVPTAVHPDDENLAADYDWDPTDEDEEGKGGWRCVSTYHDVPPVDVSVPADIVVGDPADRTLNNHFGPSAMNSASNPATRNHSTIAICVGFSVP
jgi:hypothetical protein